MKPEIAEFSTWIRETYPKALVDILDNILYLCNFNILNFVDHRFKPHGYTAIWLLSESHLAIHTFPEQNKSYIQLSSCNIKKHKKFIKLIDEIPE